MRKYNVCIDIFALLYIKLATNASMINRNILDVYGEMFERKARRKWEEESIYFERVSCEDDLQEVFCNSRDTENNVYAVLRPKYIYGDNLEEIWLEYLSNQPECLIDISIEPELLSSLGIDNQEKIFEFISKMTNKKRIRK